MSKFTPENNIYVGLSIIADKIQKIKIFKEQF